MYLEKNIKYQLSNHKLSVIIFYLAIFLFMVFFSINVSTFGGEITMMGGLEVATAIFLFILGLNSFRENFRMMVQNGISRRTMFKGFIITSIILSAGMSIINQVWLLAGKALAAPIDNLVFVGAFEQAYGQRYAENAGGFQMAFEGTLLLMFTSMAVMMFGYFITTMYYRLNKVGKVAVSVAIPVFLFVIFPYLDASLTSGALAQTISRIYLFSLGFHDGNYNPYYAMVTALINFAIFAFLGWLLVRRAVVKD